MPTLSYFHGISIQMFWDDHPVMWANEMDLAPDVIYDEIKRHGVWILR